MITIKDRFHTVRTYKYLLILPLSILLVTGLSTGGAVGLFVSYNKFNNSLSSLVTKLATALLSSLGLFILGFSGWIMKRSCQNNID